SNTTGSRMVAMRPAFRTSRASASLLLCTSRTMTDSSGVGMCSTSLAMIEARSWVGVSPAACTSLISGRVILPSGRTGTVRLTVVLFQTAMSSTSSIPILYSGPTATPAAVGAGAAAAGTDAAGAAAVGADVAGGFGKSRTGESGLGRAGSSGECGDESAARARRSDLDQTLTDRVANDAGGVGRVELLHDVRPVRLGGLHADAERLGDFLRGLAGRDQLQHFPLTRRERIGRQLRLRQIRLDDRPRDARAQVHHAVEHLVDRAHQ